MFNKARLSGNEKQIKQLIDKNLEEKEKEQEQETHLVLRSHSNKSSLEKPVDHLLTKNKVNKKIKKEIGRASCRERV